MTSKELQAAVRFTTKWARERDIRLSPDLEKGSLEDVRETVDNLVQSGLLLRHDSGQHQIYAIEPSQHPIASYYRNTVVHHLLYKAIAELAIFKAREFS